MVGQGVLRECLLDCDVERVLAVGRALVRLNPAMTFIYVSGAAPNAASSTAV